MQIATTRPAHLPPGFSSPQRIALLSVCLILTLIAIAVLRPPAEETAGNPPAQAGDPAAPQSPATPPVPVAEPPTSPNNLEIATRAQIEAVTTTGEAANIHFILIQELIPTLKDLSGIHDRNQIKLAVLDLAVRLDLLNRKIEANKFDKPGPASVTIDSHDDIESILALWGTNPDVAQTIDQLFRDRNLLADHNLAETLNRWINDVE